LKIKSNAGGLCRLSYPKITKAKLKSMDGKALHFKKEKKDLIRFETTKGLEYLFEF
jgi:hypothetical protein